MDSLYLFFRRMRAPLLVLIIAYALSIAGLVLIPGTDEQGQPWRFDFFHAFYFVSFMGSTIGFGEIPHEFNTLQRMWTTLALYVCVISWLYAIGKILTLLQDPAFRRTVSEQRFAQQVKRLARPFYLVCGYGETGSLLISALNQRNLQSVLIDDDMGRVNQLTLDSYTLDIPSLCCDAREVRYLCEAGLQHPQCQGVLALTSDEDVNVKIAITSKLLKPKLTVICRANSQSTAANLASFNTDHIINPFRIFADHLAMALRTPSVHLLYQWLITVADTPLPTPVRPPRGLWIICGFGRFGREVHRYLDYEGIQTIVIEPEAEQAPPGAIIGRGTEAVTLREAGIDKAVGLVAGADQDINNLSIVMTAKELKSDLYIVARQNRRANDAVFKAANIDLIMESSRILVWRILPLLTVPLLSRFLLEVRHHNERWAEQLLADIRSFCGGRTPHIQSLTICESETPALAMAIAQGKNIRLQHLLCNPYAREQRVECIALLLLRNDEEMLLPTVEEPLLLGDQLLFCMAKGVRQRVYSLLNDANLLSYVVTGREIAEGYVWRWLSQRFKVIS